MAGHTLSCVIPADKTVGSTSWKQGGNIAAWIYYMGWFDRINFQAAVRICILAISIRRHIRGASPSTTTMLPRFVNLHVQPTFGFGIQR